MLGRALSLATVTLLFGCFAAVPAWAQATNLEAGKSPSQIFAGTCTACHKGPRGLLKTVPAGSLQGFLRQHYTTSPEMASLLASFLISNGAADTRYAQPKEGRDGKEAKPAGGSEQLDRFGHRLRPAPSQETARPEAEPREAARPETDGLHGRKRLARPGEAPAAEGEAPAQAASEPGPDGRRLSAKQRLGKRGRPGSEEPPKTESAKTDAAKTDAAKTDGKEEPAKGEAVKEDTPKSETKNESAKVEPAKPTSGGASLTLRPDPVPPVTPAPAASPTVSAAVSSGTPEPAATPSAPPPAQQPAPPAATASAPPPAPAGPPAPPISQ